MCSLANASSRPHKSGPYYFGSHGNAPIKEYTVQHFPRTVANIEDTLVAPGCKLWCWRMKIPTRRLIQNTTSRRGTRVRVTFPRIRGVIKQATEASFYPGRWICLIAQYSTSEKSISRKRRGKKFKYHFTKLSSLRAGCTTIHFPRLRKGKFFPLFFSRTSTNLNETPRISECIYSSGERKVWTVNGKNNEIVPLGIITIFLNLCPINWRVARIAQWYRDDT